jgi:hypothetical protein
MAAQNDVMDLETGLCRRVLLTFTKRCNFHADPIERPACSHEGDKTILHDHTSCSLPYGDPSYKRESGEA